MTLTHLAEGLPEIRVDGDVVHIRDLVVPHPEAAGLLRAQLNEAGPEVAADIVRRALPIGLVALNLSSSAVDSGALARTLSGFADLIDSRATAAIHELETAMARVRQGEQGIAETARLVLGGLPKQIDAALAGQSESVRSAVVEAAMSVQDSGLQQLTAALGQHSAAIQKELSLDREGPLRSLRQDLLNQLDGARRELGSQLSEVRALVEAAQAAKVAGAKSSRAVGADVERDLMALCNEVVTAAGDLFEETGNHAGVNGRRTGDGVATLSELVSGPGRRIRIVLESKSRSRPMSVKALRQEAANACATREADGVLIVVPTRAEVPGQASVCRLDTSAYVVSAEDGGEVTSWSYLLLREQVALLARRNTVDSTVDLSVVEARITAALQSIGELDEVGKYANPRKTEPRKAHRQRPGHPAAGPRCTDRRTRRATGLNDGEGRRSVPPHLLIGLGQGRGAGLRQPITLNSIQAASSRCPARRLAERSPSCVGPMVHACGVTQPPQHHLPEPDGGEDSTGGWHPMYERIGPFYDSSGAAHRLGVDEEALAARREERTLLAMRTGSGEWLYPAWQFTVEGPVHEQLAPVLAALRGLDQWAAGIWIVNEHPDLGGMSPRKALASGMDVATVARLAQHDAGILNA